MPAKTLVQTSAAVCLVILLGYLLVFGRALGQDEPHLSIALAIPQIFMTGGARVHDLYVARSTDDFYAAMQNEGYTPFEQLGAGHVFEKNGARYISMSRMYSAYFMVFSLPELQVGSS